MAGRPHLTHFARVRAAVVWDALTAALAALGDGPLDVVDVGGGTGGFGVPVALLGHRVTVIDPSPDSLAALERRATEDGAKDIRGVQGDIDTLLESTAAASADVVLCHNVLEVVDDPAKGLATVAAVLKPGGLASVLALNKTAAVFSRAIAGRFTEAAAALDDVDGRWGEADPARRRFARDELVALLQGAGLEPQDVHGVRVFTDLVAGGLLDTDPLAFEALVALETAASSRSPYADVATQLHVIARRAS